MPSWRVFLVLPESQNVVMRPLALRLSKEPQMTPQLFWKLALGPVSWSICALL